MSVRRHYYWHDIDSLDVWELTTNFEEWFCYLTELLSLGNFLFTKTWNRNSAEPWLLSWEPRQCLQKIISLFSMLLQQVWHSQGQSSAGFKICPSMLFITYFQFLARRNKVSLLSPWLGSYDQIWLMCCKQTLCAIIKLYTESWLWDLLIVLVSCPYCCDWSYPKWWVLCFPEWRDFEQSSQMNFNINGGLNKTYHLLLLSYSLLQYKDLSDS